MSASALWRARVSTDGMHRVPSGEPRQALRTPGEVKVYRINRITPQRDPYTPRTSYSSAHTPCKGPDRSPNNTRIGQTLQGKEGGGELHP